MFLRFFCRSIRQYNSCQQRTTVCQIDSTCGPCQGSRQLVVKINCREYIPQKCSYTISQQESTMFHADSATILATTNGAMYDKQIDLQQLQ